MYYNNKETLKVTYSMCEVWLFFVKYMNSFMLTKLVEAYGNKIKIRLLSIYQCARRWFDFGCLVDFCRKKIHNELYLLYKRAGQHDIDLSRWHLCVCVFSVSEAVDFQLKTLVFPFAGVLETEVTRTCVRVLQQSCDISAQLSCLLIFGRSKQWANRTLRYVLTSLIQNDCFTWN
jgi:hypothetical protein